MRRASLILPLLFWAVLGCARETEAVTCVVTYGGKERPLEFRATTTPYEVRAVNIDGRFAFKATFVREPWEAVYSLGNFLFHLLDQPDNAVGWRLHLVVYREGVVNFTTAAVRIDAEGRPLPAPELKSPCGERGAQSVVPCEATELR